MLISGKAVEELKKKLVENAVAEGQPEVFCAGLFFSAQWFVVSNIGNKCLNFIVLPDKDTAEYCAADLYNMVEGDRVFFLPDSGKSLERSNYKASLSVQRTAAIGKIIDYNGEEPLFIVTYPSALEEPVPSEKAIKKSVLTLRKGEETDMSELGKLLYDNGFVREDFVYSPGQYAMRGGIIDIFSYSYNNPFRISFFGDEIEKINIFDTNTQLSVAEEEVAEIYPDISSDNSGAGENLITSMPPSASRNSC